MPELKSCLQATFPLQKQDITDNLTIAKLKDKWPGLMTVDGHISYLKNALGIEIDCKFRHSLQENCDRIQK